MFNPRYSVEFNEFFKSVTKYQNDYIQDPEGKQTKRQLEIVLNQFSTLSDYEKSQARIILKNNFIKDPWHKEDKQTILLMTIAMAILVPVLGAASVNVSTYFDILKLSVGGAVLGFGAGLGRGNYPRHLSAYNRLLSGLSETSTNHINPLNMHLHVAAPPPSLRKLKHS